MSDIIGLNIESIMSANIPNHIAFIMDGNRRWAVKHGLAKMDGHTKGLENFKEIVRHCNDLKIPVITFWALSTDNLKKREEKELKHLFGLLAKIKEYLEDFKKYGARVEYLGDLSKLPGYLRVVLNDIKKKTAKNSKMRIVLAINYGGKDEIVRLIKDIVGAGIEGKAVTNALIEQYIDSGKLPEVDLLIRTGGHRRLSGFLPWIADYAELYFTDKYWPEFSKKDLDIAIDWYGKQERNFGK